MHPSVREYEVFARKSRVDPLHQVGSVVAPDDDLARAYARATYDEERWIEMVIVPKEAVITLWAPGEDGVGLLSLPSLVRSLADNKQLLGMRYAEWCIAAPTLEADIAAAAMGLDDIGHSRVLAGCLKELDGQEEPGGDRGYRNIAFLDRPWNGWGQFIAANVVIDSAFSLMIEALASGDVEVLRTRLRKMLQEERYHYLHGHSWMKEANATDAIAGAWREAIEWFGPEGGDVDELKRSGALAMGVADLRGRLRDRIGSPEPRSDIEWSRWDPLRRRTSAGEIDRPTLEMIQGLAERRYMPSG